MFIFMVLESRSVILVIENIDEIIIIYQIFDISSFRFFVVLLYTARKTMFSFSICSEKMVFSKGFYWNMIFFVLSRKRIFLFHKNIILFFRQKMKDDLSQKNTCKYGIFRKNALKRLSFRKKVDCNMIFLVISGKMILFPQKYDLIL